MIKTLDGKPLSTWGIIQEFYEEHPITQEIEQQTVKIAGVDGFYDFGSKSGCRPFSFPLAKIEKNSVVMQNKMTEFVGFLLDEYGKPREMKLVFAYEPNKYYLVKLAEMISLRRLHTVNKFTLNIVAYDPWKYSVANNKEIAWGSDEIDFTMDYLFGTVGGEVHTITSNKKIVETVNGYAIRPVFLLDGTGTNVSISVNGKVINIGTFSNTEWVIDCEKYTIVRNGLNGIGSLSGPLETIELLPGDNEIAINGAGMNLTFETSFRDKYM